jgi:hypothetical protein
MRATHLKSRCIVRLASACLSLALLLPAAHAQIKYASEAEIAGAAAVSPDSGLQILQKVVDFCGAYSPALLENGQRDLAAWKERHRAYLDENRLVRTELAALAERQGNSSQARENIHKLFNETMPAAVDKEFEVLAAPVRNMQTPMEQIARCQLYVRAMADGTFDLRRTDPTLANYLDQRITKRTGVAPPAALAAIAEPQPEQIRRFYEEHPELFAHRRVYTYQALVAKGAAEDLTTLRNMVEQKMTIEAITAWAKERKLQIAQEQRSQAAERIPFKVLPTIADLKDGDITIVPGPEGALVFQLDSSKDEPISLERATPSIRAFLLNPKGEEALRK